MLLEMRALLESRAAENGRSLSGEIVYRLRRSLEQEMEHEKRKAEKSPKRANA
ncbi:Arc family DNA-binding protein [Pseudomonas sp. MD195_PC81_125]|nr:Arc family DNA-binding protein [Pseudomonas sp. MD195_PC81_125]